VQSRWVKKDDSYIAGVKLVLENIEFFSTSNARTIPLFTILLNNQAVLNHFFLNLSKRMRVHKTIKSKSKLIVLVNVLVEVDGGRFQNVLKPYGIVENKTSALSIIGLGNSPTFLEGGKGLCVFITVPLACYFQKFYSPFGGL